MRVLSVAMVLAATTLPAVAAGTSFGSFYVDDEEPRLIVLAGPIQHNAPIDLRRALRAFPDLDTMALHSEGGDVTAGLLIAQEVFDLGLDTMIAPDSYCYSACAYVFLAGRNRTVGGQLGVHQMANEEGDTYSLQLSISDMLDTMAEFDVPPLVISEMLRTAPDDMRIYTSVEAESMGLNRGVVGLLANAGARPELKEAPVAANSPLSFPLLEEPLSPRFPPMEQPSRLPTPSQALMFVASSDNSVSADQSRGTVWWTDGTATDGKPFITAEVSIYVAPYIMDAKLRFSDAADGTVPAEFIIEASFSFNGRGEIDSVTAIAGVLTKSELYATGQPLVGASAKVTNDKYIFAGSSDEPYATENLIRLSEPFIDLALILDSGRNAILTLAMDGPSEQLMQDTLEAWAE